MLNLISAGFWGAINTADRAIVSVEKMMVDYRLVNLGIKILAYGASYKLYQEASGTNLGFAAYWTVALGSIFMLIPLTYYLEPKRDRLKSMDNQERKDFARLDHLVLRLLFVSTVLIPAGAINIAISNFHRYRQEDKIIYEALEKIISSPQSNNEEYWKWKKAQLITTIKHTFNFVIALYSTVPMIVNIPFLYIEKRYPK